MTEADTMARFEAALNAAVDAGDEERTDALVAEAEATLSPAAFAALMEACS